MAQKRKVMSGDGMALYNAVYGKVLLKDFARTLDKGMSTLHTYFNSETLPANIKAACAEALGKEVSAIFGRASKTVKAKQIKNTDSSWTGIGYRVKRARMGLGFTGAEFCRDLGSIKDKEKPFDIGSLSRIESGESRLPDWVLFELVTRYGINETWLLTGKGKSGIII